jgi:hypothetical protein
MNKKTLKRIGAGILVIIFIAGSIGAYMWFKPHRDVQATKAFAEMKSSELLQEFSTDANAANAKYLSRDGNSKVLVVEGRVSKISTNQSGEAVIILMDEGAKVGVSGTFTLKTSPNTAGIKVGDIIKIKGAITTGNSYDANLDLYEHTVLVQCDIIK